VYGLHFAIMYTQLAAVNLAIVNLATLAPTKIHHAASMPWSVQAAGYVWLTWLDAETGGGQWRFLFQSGCTFQSL
jgi:hypothetical protein